MSSIDENVCVEYGADLHSVEHGSGFPTKRTSNLDEVSLTNTNLFFYA